MIKFIKYVIITLLSEELFLSCQSEPREKTFCNKQEDCYPGHSLSNVNKINYDSQTFPKSIEENSASSSTNKDRDLKRLKRLNVNPKNLNNPINPKRPVLNEKFIYIGGLFDILSTEGYSELIAALIAIEDVNRNAILPKPYKISLYYNNSQV